MKVNVQIQSYIFLALAMILAGSAVIAGKLLVSSIPVFLAAEMGIFVSLIILFPLVYLQYRGQLRLDARTHCLLLGQAICGIVLYRVCIFWGLKYTSAAAGGLISSATPAFIALMAFLLLREKMMTKHVVGIACVSAGVAVVNILPLLNDSVQVIDSFKGNCLVLAAVFCEALFSIMSKSRCRPMSAIFRTAMVSLYAFLCLLPFALYDAALYDFSTMGKEAVLCIGYYGFFVSFLSYLFWFKGIECVQASSAASLTGFVPITAIILSACILREKITIVHIAGLLLIVIGIYCSCRVAKQPVGAVNGM